MSHGCKHPKLVILDRDGVINQDSPDYIKSVAEWVPIPRSLKAIVRLNHAGWLVAIASNQSGIARGLFDLATLEQIHQMLRQQLSTVGGHIDAIAFCPHGPDHGCTCRKPAPGLLINLAARFAVNLAQVTVIGDSLRDIQAAQAVGAQPILVNTGNGAATAQRETAALAGVRQYADLYAAVDDLLLEDENP